MKLYYAPGSCSLAAHIILNELKAPFDAEKVDLKTHQIESGQDFYQINPKGFVPTLEAEGGVILTENVAILPYLAEQDPNQKMIATSGLARAKTLEWLGFLNSQLHKAYLPLFYGNLDEQGQKDAYAKVDSYLAYIDQYIANTPHEFLTGDHFGPADAYLFVIGSWSSYVDHDLTPYSHLVAFREKIAQREAVQLTLKQEGLI